MGGRVILRPPVFFLPDFRDNVGLPGFPPPEIPPLGLRDKVGLPAGVKGLLGETAGSGESCSS